MYLDNDNADAQSDDAALGTALDAYASWKKWKDRAACRHPDFKFEDFFLESRFKKNSTAYNRAKARAKAVCNVCVVRQQCLDFAVTLDLRDGIWGGRTANERRNLRWPTRKVHQEIA